MDTFYPKSQNNTIYVNTLKTRKVFYLPAVSTIPPGTLLYIKDICGNAANSSITLSTTGYYDTIDYSSNYNSTLTNILSPSYTILSTNGVSAMLMPDGKTNWIVLQNNVSNPIYGTTGYSSFLYTYFYNLSIGDSTISNIQNSTYITGGYIINTPTTSPLGPGNQGWFYPLSAVNSSIIDITNLTLRGFATSNNWGFGSKGYIYSATNTTIQFQTICDDGMVVFYNNSTVLSNWSNVFSNSAITQISPALPLNAGYTPIKITYYQSSLTNRALFSWSIPAGGEFISNGTGVLYHNDSSKYWP